MQPSRPGEPGDGCPSLDRHVRGRQGGGPWRHPRAGGADDLRLFAGTMHLGKPVAGSLDEGPTFSMADAVGPVLHFRDATPCRSRACPKV